MFGVFVFVFHIRNWIYIGDKKLLKARPAGSHLLACHHPPAVPALGLQEEKQFEGRLGGRETVSKMKAILYKQRIEKV